MEIEFDPEKLMPNLRPGHWATLRDDWTPMWHRRATSLLVESLALDTEEQIILLQDDAGSSFGLDDDSAFEIARQNLMAQFDPDLFVWMEITDDPESHCFYTMAPYGYQSSWALLPQAINDITALVINDERYQPKPVFFVPDVNELWIVTDTMTKTIEILLEKATYGYTNSSVPVAPYPLTYDDEGTLIPWIPEEPDSLRVAVLNALALAASEQYSFQKEWLENDVIGRDYLAESNSFLVDFEYFESTGKSYCRIYEDLTPVR